MAQAIFHIGAGKCGSSALQTALTNNPVSASNGSKLEYGLLTAKGFIPAGQFKAGDRGYAASKRAALLTSLDDAVLRKAGKEIRDRPAKYVLFSEESWLLSVKDLCDLFKRMQITDPIILAYIRPQIDWLNSGWWQWGAFEDLSLENWIKKWLSALDWARALQRWKETGLEVKFRILPRDIVQDALSVFGAALNSDSSFRINAGLPASFLRVMQRNRQLRPGPHDSIIDFSMSRQLGLSGSAPWVLSTELIGSLLAHFREKNLRLAELLDPDQAKILLDDPRWWSADAYANKVLETADPKQPSADDLEELCVKMAEAILRLDLAQKA